MTGMKRKIISFLLALSMLTLAGCQEWDAQQSAGVYVQLPEGTLDTADENKNAPEDAALPEDGEETPEILETPADILYEDGTAEQSELDENGTYNSAEDVSLYLHLYDHLPDNYITKSEARDLGWTGGSVERYAPGCAIGGDRFGNREGLLPTAKGRSYYECDIDTTGETSRGAKRIIFSNDGLIYYTEDHYESFTLLYGEE